ncbi:MAG: hypothetical protein AB7O96_11540 [Pseudobdellovibrionaceae bacterium]
MRKWFGLVLFLIAFSTSDASFLGYSSAPRGLFHSFDRHSKNNYRAFKKRINRSFASDTPLPQDLRMGAATIHRYRDGGQNLYKVSVFVPLPDENPQGLLVNYNKRILPTELKNRFVIGDGSAKRSFTGVDLSPTSSLSKGLDKIIKDYKKSRFIKMTDGPQQFVRTKTRDYLGYTPEEGADGRAEFPWDLKIRLKNDLAPFMTRAADEPVFKFPIITPERFPVTPLEKYLQVKKGYCLQVALLGSLILSKLNVTHRLVNGAVINELPNGNYYTGGHTWIELQDGAIVDPTWKLLEETPEKKNQDPVWIGVNGGWRFENTNYPVLELYEP